jgi:hypothetical protein
MMFMRGKMRRRKTAGEKESPYAGQEKSDKPESGNEQKKLLKLSGGSQESV